MKDCRWLICPVCGRKTRNQVRADTILVNYSHICPKCKHELLINVVKMNISIVREPDAKTQSQ